jgi:hypothetical protein
LLVVVGVIASSYELFEICIFELTPLVLVQSKFLSLLLHVVCKVDVDRETVIALEETIGWAVGSYLMAAVHVSIAVIRAKQLGSNVIIKGTLIGSDVLLRLHNAWVVPGEVIPEFLILILILFLIVMIWGKLTIAIFHMLSSTSNVHIVFLCKFK